jgi:chromosomal replication initiator protein
MHKTVNQRPLISRSHPLSAIDEAAGEAWAIISASLKNSLPEQAYHTWFNPIIPVEFSSGILTIQVPSKFYYEWIEGHYAAHIERVLDETFGSEGQLVYVVGSPIEEQKIEKKVINRPEPVQKIKPPLIQNKVNGNSGSLYGLNPRYKFDTFIEGPQNQFARAASQAVGSSPGRTAYNPMLIYGGVGLGKTHLLQAIGREVIEHSPKAVVKYISSERFTQDFVESIKSNKANEFSAKYRVVDVLLVDDVQFLVGRERTQMEFFHTFNTLHQLGKQIVLSSDKPPRELDGLDERLISRFGWGLVCDISPPDYDTRIAIIQKFSEAEKIYLDPEVIEYIAGNFTKNIREMQGALVRLMAHASLRGSEVTIELAKKALRDLIGNRELKISIDDIKMTVANHYNVAPDLLMAKVRTQPIAKARMVAMALGTRMTGLSLKQVGAQFGKRDHTTVLHARDKVIQWEREDDDFSYLIEKLIEKIENVDR